MKRGLFRLFLHSAKWLGLFHLAERLGRGQLRLLCYHGASLDDEHLFRPALFMRPERFAERMHWLREHGWTVLPLGRALALCRAGALPARAAVITLDDGWVGSQIHMFPLLARLGLPATLYVPTAYMLQDAPVGGVMIDYLFWKSRARTLDLDGLAPALEGRFRLDLDTERATARGRMLELYEGLSGAEARHALLRALATRLGVDYGALRRQRLCHIARPEELARAARDGLDLQLHTHDHIMPEDEAGLRTQIEANRRHLRPLGTAPLEHLCYPSGEYCRAREPLLASLGVRSATTCESGLVHPDTPALALPRFLDRDDFEPIEFEAELRGFRELLRRLRAQLAPRRRLSPPDTHSRLPHSQNSSP